MYGNETPIETRLEKAEAFSLTSIELLRLKANTLSDITPVQQTLKNSQYAFIKTVHDKVKNLRDTLQEHSLFYSLYFEIKSEGDFVLFRYFLSPH